MIQDCYMHFNLKEDLHVTDLFGLNLKLACRCDKVCIEIEMIHQHLAAVSELQTSQKSIMYDHCNNPDPE